MTYAKEDVKESLTTDDIFNLLEFFNAEPKMASGDIVAKTICHNGDTHKLYYYEENQMFHCYSDSCGTFDVIELVQKVEHIDDFNQAINFLVRFFNLESVLDNVDLVDRDLEDWKIFEKYANDGDQSEELGSLLLDSYDDRILKYYPKPHIIPWEKDGISKEVCDYMGICYDPVQGAILRSAKRMKVTAWPASRAPSATAKARVSEFPLFRGEEERTRTCFIMRSFLRRHS